MINDIKIASLGNKGETVKAVITHTGQVGKQYMLSPMDIDVWTHIDQVMTPMVNVITNFTIVWQFKQCNPYKKIILLQIKEFCEKTEHYIPIKNELCLALYDGVWYRAACFEPRETDTMALIFFLDYGNVESVKHQNIRRMPEDFISPAAMANMCIVISKYQVINKFTIDIIFVI